MFGNFFRYTLYIFVYLISVGIAIGIRAMSKGTKVFQKSPKGDEIIGGHAKQSSVSPKTNQEQTHKSYNCCNILRTLSTKAIFQRPFPRP
jgi:hypothetical protein